MSEQNIPDFLKVGAPPLNTAPFRSFPNKPKEPSGEQIAAAVNAFQASTGHVHLNITTAQFVLAMVAAIDAANKAG